MELVLSNNNPKNAENVFVFFNTVCTFFVYISFKFSLITFNIFINSFSLLISIETSFFFYYFCTFFLLNFSRCYTVITVKLCVWFCFWVINRVHISLFPFLLYLFLFLIFFFLKQLLFCSIKHTLLQMSQ